jgi:para-nitrobenzyl esterase
MKTSEAGDDRLEHSGSALKILLAAATICVVALGWITPASSENLHGHPFARTESGLVIGSTTNGINEFLGIPYAASPVGALRWTPPKRYGSFPGLVLEATQFGSQCPQPGGIGSEDCLFLNVYTPHNPSAEDGLRRHRLPVMVWIHGGSLIRGGSNPYDPARLVKKGVIVVTINYRLGYFGLFAYAAIDAEGHLNGNYGLMDQQFALKWVRDNIAGFGGDPDRITIFGESAGGQSVYAHLASPLAAGLFHRAIAESGSYLNFQDYYNFIVPLTIAETTGTALGPSGSAIAESVGCTSQSASCLRAVPASALVAIAPSTLYPFVDGALLTQTMSAAFASGQFNRVPLISGTNHDEWRYFVALQYDLAENPILNSVAYNAAVAALWGPALTPSVLALYPFAGYPSGGEALGASGTDGIISCPAHNAVQSLSKFVPTYAYEFNDENAPPPQSAFGGALTFPLGAYHTAELQYLFIGSFFGLPTALLSSEQQRLSNAMVGYWTQFAKTGDPNSPGAPAWSPYDATADQFQSLLPPAPTVESNFAAAHQCSTFWNTF